MTDQQTSLEAPEQAAQAPEQQEQVENQPEPKPETHAEPTPETAPEPAPSGEDQWASILRQRRGEEDPEKPEPEDPEPGQGTEGGEPEPGKAAEAAPEQGAQETPEDYQKRLKGWFDEQPEWAQQEMLAWEQQNQALQQQYQNMQHQYQSMHARVSPVQRQLEEHRKRNEELTQRLESIERDAPESVEELEKLEAFKLLSEEYPEDASALKKAVSLLLQKSTGNAEAKVAEVRKAWGREQTAIRQREAQKLIRKYPNHMQVRQSQEFNYWLAHQPPQVQQMANSPWADDRIALFDQCIADWQAAQQAQTQPQQPKPETGKAKPKPTPSPPSQGSGVSGARQSEVARDPEDMWGEVLEERRRLKGG